MKETILEKITRWCSTGKTGVAEMIEEDKEMIRRMAYERDVDNLLHDIEFKYPSLIGKRDEIMKILHYYNLPQKD